MTDSYNRASGLCLCLAAVMTLALNILVSPQLPDGLFGVVAASQVYFVRQVIAAVVAMLLVFGLVGLRETRLAGTDKLASLAHALALTGQVLLFAIEFGQAFFVHDYALRAPLAVNSASADPTGPFLLGAFVAIPTFYLGWLLLAVTLLRARRVSRWSAGPLLLGFLISPALSAIKLLGVLAGIIVSTIIGAGWFLLGLQMLRKPNGEPPAD